MTFKSINLFLYLTIISIPRYALQFFHFLFIYFASSQIILDLGIFFLNIICEIFVKLHNRIFESFTYNYLVFKAFLIPIDFNHLVVYYYIDDALVVVPHYSE